MDEERILDRILDHARNPRNKRKLQDPDLTQPGGNPGCGDVQVWMLRLDAEGRITELGWEGHGCNLSMAGASLLSERLMGKSGEEILALPHGALLEILGGKLPLTRPRCSSLALNTLKAGFHRWLRERGRAVPD